VSRPGFELSASECKSKCKPTCCRQIAVEECSVSSAVNPVYLFHSCPTDGAVGSRVNQQRSPTFRSARFLQIRIASGVTSECVAGAVAFVLYSCRLGSARLGSARLDNVTWFVHSSKNYEALSVVQCKMPQVKDVQSDVAVVRRCGTLSYFLTIVKTFKGL